MLIALYFLPLVSTLMTNLTISEIGSVGLGHGSVNIISIIRFKSSLSFGLLSSSQGWQGTQEMKDYEVLNLRLRLAGAALDKLDGYWNRNIEDEEHGVAAKRNFHEFCKCDVHS